MSSYQDLTLLPDPEFPGATLLNALFARFHRTLVRVGEGDIGISFPQASSSPRQMGAVLRLHGKHEQLAALHANPWLLGMSDHVRVGEIMLVPASATHCRVRRVQAKSNVDRIRRRQMKRHGYSAEEAAQRIPVTVEERLDLPYLEIQSASSGKTFRLFVDQQRVEGPTQGSFNAYGLSQSATVPWF